jgi:hypothetical protein
MPLVGPHNADLSSWVVGIAYVVGAIVVLPIKKVR